LNNFFYLRRTPIAGWTHSFLPILAKSGIAGVKGVPE
jgi:hypothetical protein